MTLDEQDLRRGLKFIVGTWQVDYVVNAWSNDLAHIPAKEFKNKDGSDFSEITFTFSEDHTVLMKNGADGKEEKGQWEQTGWAEYHYTLNGFIDIPDGNFRKNAETLSVFDGFLVFSIGFLAIGMKKISDGVVTEVKKKDIGDMEMSAADAAADGIVGKYAPAKTMAVVNDSFGLYTKEEIEAEFKRKQDAGEEFKVRQGASWDVNYGADGTIGGPNVVVEADGTYVVRLTIADGVGTIELIAQ